MNIRSEQFPQQGTHPIGVSESDRLPWEEKPLLLLPKSDVVNRENPNPFGGFRTLSAPFLVYPLKNTAQVEQEDKQLTELHDVPLEPKKENPDLAQITVEPPQTINDRKELIDSQQRVPHPTLPKTVKPAVEESPDKKTEVPSEEPNLLGAGTIDNPIPTSAPPKKRKGRLL
jgi:hypothetical protein